MSDISSTERMNIIAFIILIFSLAPFFIQRLTGKFLYFALLAIIAIGLHGIYFFGFQILYFLLITYLVSTAVELISLKTRINFFGIKYWYNLKHPFFTSKVNFLEVYPLEVSLAWVLLKYLSFSMALLISAAFPFPLIWNIAITPLILVSVDFIIDPIAVHRSKLWKWKKGSFYFGIPFRNFLGWYFVGLIITLIFNLLITIKPISFHFLYIIPILSYASFLTYIPQLIRLDKKLAIIGSLPATIWTILGSISLLILYQKQF